MAGESILGDGGSRPPDFGQGGRGRVAGARGILLYLIMYRKYIRKWWILKWNRIICQDVAVNGQFLPGNSKFILIIWKIEIFSKFAWKNRNLLVKLPEKIEIFRKFAWKNQHFFTLIHDPSDFKPDWRRCYRLLEFILDRHNYAFSLSRLYKPIWQSLFFFFLLLRFS